MSAHWSHEPSGERADEDVAVAIGSTLAIADGVTRDPRPDGTYPRPSPAAMAATLFCSVLEEHHRDAPGLIFCAANSRIAEFNRESGLEANRDVSANDLAGTVAALARAEPADRVTWAYIGDAGAALVADDGTIVEQTPDDVDAARRHFPAGVSPHESRAIIRGELRNHPNCPPGGYGVLTGEASALKYMHEGVWAAGPSIGYLVFSDGFRPMLQSAEVRRALAGALRGDRTRDDVIAACNAKRARSATSERHEAIVVARRLGRGD